MRLVITKSCVWVKSCVLKTFRERAFDYGPNPVHFAKVLGCFGVSVESKCANTKLPFSSCLQRSHSAFHFRSSLCSAQAPSPFSNCLYGIFKSNFCLCQYFFFLCVHLLWLPTAAVKTLRYSQSTVRSRINTARPLPSSNNRHRAKLHSREPNFIQGIFSILSNLKISSSFHLEFERGC